MCFIDLLAATALFLLKIWVSKAKNGFDTVGMVNEEARFNVCRNFDNRDLNQSRSVHSSRAYR